MYPAAVLLHAFADTRARARWRSALWMLIPAAAFTAGHFFLMPRASSPVYQLVVDGRMPATFLRYLGWTAAADLIIKGMDGAIAARTVTYDFARLMEGAKEVKCSEFADAVIAKM